MGNRHTFRKRLYDKNPYCPRCGVEMILPEDLPRHPRKVYEPTVHPDNMCMYEHKYSRLNKKRGTRDESQNSILCRKCNNELGKIEENKLTIEELRKRSCHK